MPDLRSQMNQLLDKTNSIEQLHERCCDFFAIEKPKNSDELKQIRQKILKSQEFVQDLQYKSQALGKSVDKAIELCTKQCDLQQLDRDMKAQQALESEEPKLWIAKRSYS